MTDKKVILHQFPRGECIPSYSPFCLKLETFLRMYNVPYTNKLGLATGKKGKNPWIEYEGDEVADSTFIIDYLNEKLALKMDEMFTKEQRAVGRSVKVMLEENTNWTNVYIRFRVSYPSTRKLMIPPGFIYGIGGKLLSRQINKYLNAQGIGRHSKDEVLAIAKKDIKAVSDILGEKKYLLGDSISSFDCTVFGTIGMILYDGIDSPLPEYIKTDADNLFQYCERLKKEFWPDWDDLEKKTD